MSRLKDELQHVAIAFYIVMTVSGMSYTLFRYKIPLVPKKVWVFSYGMMAPFQQYRTYNEELVAEGRMPGGEWKPIDTDQYFPFIRGERAMRSYLAIFRMQGDDVWPDKYRTLARAIQSLEAEQGREWQSVRLHLQKWWMSPAGYEFNRTKDISEFTFLVQVP